MEEREYEINVNLNSNSNSNSNSAFMFCAFISVWLTIGDPDLIDALIHFLMK